MASTACESCLYFYYDDETDEYLCEMTDCMDEDDVFRLESEPRRGCPYYRPGDEYTIVRRQN